MLARFQVTLRKSYYQKGSNAPVAEPRAFLDGSGACSSEAPSGRRLYSCGSKNPDDVPLSGAVMEM